MEPFLTERHVVGRPQRKTGGEIPVFLVLRTVRGGPRLLAAGAGSSTVRR
jgi:hypothetical protein